MNDQAHMTLSVTARGRERASLTRPHLARIFGEREDAASLPQKDARNAWLLRIAQAAGVERLEDLVAP
jgi:hypothetical protein